MYTSVFLYLLPVHCQLTIYYLNQFAIMHAVIVAAFHKSWLVF